jgi:general stress protein YciG
MARKDAQRRWEARHPDRVRAYHARWRERTRERRRAAGDLVERDRAFYVATGRKGGEATRARHDAGHYAAMGRKGGATVRDRLGVAHFSELGKLSGAARRAGRRPEGGGADATR